MTDRLIQRMWLRTRGMSVPVRYAWALLFAVLVGFLRVELNASWGGHQPYILIFPATLVIALFAGTAPALVAMLVMTSIVARWVLPPDSVFTDEGVMTRLGIFLLTDAGVAWLGGQHRLLLAETEAQRAELDGQTAARSVAEERLQIALDAAGMASWDWDVDTGAVERSPNATRVLGVPVEKIEQFLAALHPEDGPLFEQMVGAVLRGEGVYQMEYRVMQPDGSIRWMSDKGTLSTHPKTGHRHLAGVCADVTARRTAEDALRDAHALLDTLRSQAPIGFAYLDRELRYRSINRWLADINGLSEAEHIGRSVRDIVPSLGDQVEAVTAKILATGETVQNVELCGNGVGDTGGLRWWNESWYPVRNRTGEITGFGVVVEEITARKQGEEALRQGEKRLRLLAETLPQFVWQSASDGSLQYVNRRWTEYSGLDVEGTRDAQKTKSLYHPEDGERARAAWIHSLATGTPMRQEARLRSRHGEFRWFIIQAEPVIEDGKVNCWFGTSTEIDDRKRAEDALRQSEESFRSLANAMPQLVWVSGADGAVTYYNNRAENYQGLTQSADGRWEWRPLLHPDDLEPTVKAWHGAVTEGRSYEIEHRVRMADGEFRWHLSRAFPIQRDGEVQWFGTATDVHDMKETQEALRRARDEAERASRAKDDFLAALSHELRTPLTPVLMSAGALRADDRLPVELRNELEMINRNIRLEVRLIDDLLDLTRITRGKLPLRIERCDLHQLISVASEFVWDAAREKRIDLQFDFAAASPCLSGDATRLQQVFWNVLRNAVKFTPDGGKVTTRTVNTPDRVRVEISDTGVGFSSGDAERIFAPFEQGAAGYDHRFGGLGLGLAIARAVVEQHGGRITASSPGPNRGATFTIDLPAATDSPVPENGSREASRASEVEPLRVLLVEDHEPTINVLTRLLLRAGHEVATANSIAAALDQARTTSVDVVISDLGLPDGTGLELMPQLRAIHASVHGVALSGYGMEEDIRRSLNAGFSAHLVKPVDFEELQRVLATAQSQVG